ncbi:MAG: glycosyltransferase family 2 protein [Gemmatimonadales bacterium]
MTTERMTRVTVVVEWDNVRLSELQRARRMLGALGRQATEVGTPPAWATEAEVGFLRSIATPLEVLVTFDDGEFPEAGVREVVQGCLPQDSRGLAVRFLPVPGARYYQLKNAGAALAGGDLIVFLDSDAIPEPGWLQGLLAGFADDSRQVIGGNTYVEPDGVYGKSFALAWFFPLREDDAGVAPARSFMVNNVAFRRETMLTTGFQDEPGISKGACIRLAQRLLSDGVPVHHAPRAHCSHPAPNGLRHFLVRAVAQGRDYALAPVVPPVSFLGACRQVARYLRWSTRRVVLERRQVGLSLAAVPASLAIAWTYYSLYFAGSAMGLVAPGWMRRRFQL